MAQELPEIESLETLKGLMNAHKVRKLIFKNLSPNDNSKNQIYLGGNYSSLQLLPFGKVTTDKSRTDSKRDRMKANLSFYWLDNTGHLFEAPNAQLIMYPRYPEVRMSGFLMGAKRAPGRYLRSRDEGRILILGITDDRRIVGHVAGASNPLIRELKAWSTNSVFSEIPLALDHENSQSRLIEKLAEISMLGWIDSCKLDRDGQAQLYRARNGGGYTLEAKLGILPNGRNEPDYLGWEVKQHNCKLDDPLSGGPITLMTPEPTGGYYKSHSIVDFVNKFGYPDKSGKIDRFNFGGVHKFGMSQALTGLTLELSGYDTDTGKIEDINGGIILRSENGLEAAIWHFSTLLEKWTRKHAKAVYVPSQRRGEGTVRYRFGHAIALGIGTDFGKFLKALADSSVYYDPGIKVENISTSPKAKKRSQFRIRARDLSKLYETLELIDLVRRKSRSTV